jgi:hypothetical protein
MLAALLFALAGAASSWHDARAIVIPNATLPAYVRLALPQYVDGGPDGTYPSVRVVDANGIEVPYALDTDPAVATGGTAELSDVGFVPGKYTQAIADLGAAGALHSVIALDSSQPTYFEHVEIASSDDRHTWSVLVPSALIYRVSTNGDNGTNSIEFGPSRARWLRIRVLDGARAFPISGASVPATAPPPHLVPLTGTQTLQQLDSKTVVTIDFQTPDTSLDAIAIETATAEYHRRVIVEGDDGTSPGWQPVAQSDIVRYAGARAGSGTGPLIVTGTQHVRRIQITIENGNDVPLATPRITALGRQHQVVFRATPGTQYRLLWNAAGADAPVYDLADLLGHQAWSVGAVATLGAAASTAFAPAAVAQTPWLQQAALPIALSLLCIVLLAVVLIAMRSKPAA